MQIDESKLELPLHLKKPRMIFVNSMSDLFHEKIPFEIIDRCWGIMSTNPQHTYQILTKRPERLLEYCKYQSEKTQKEGYEKINNWAFDISDFIWLGVSVEDQRAANERRGYLKATPAAVRWVSYEPALSEVNWAGWEFINWIVLGCESGHNKRYCDLLWFEKTIRWARKNNIKIFIKQIPINGKVIKDINLFPKYLQIREYPK